MPSHQWGDQVCDTEDVETSGEGTAGDAVEGGCVPGYLGLVYCQVGGDGAVQSLGGEDRVGIGGFCWLRLSVGFCGGGLESDVPGLRSQSACCNGCWRGEFGEGGLLGEEPPDGLLRDSLSQHDV